MVKREIAVASRQAAMAAKGVNVSVESVLAEIEVQIELKWNPLETILFGREEGFSFLDEADRLFDLGFERDIRAIVEKLQEKSSVARSKRRQNVLLSATLTPSIASLANEVLENPLFVGFSGKDQMLEGTSESQVQDTQPQAKQSLVPKSIVSLAFPR